MVPRTAAGREPLKPRRSAADSCLQMEPRPFFPVRRARSLHGTAVAAAVTLLGLVLVMGGRPASAAAAGRFPVPTCRWVSAGAVGHAFGVQVRAQRPVWSTVIAPVLTCGFAERHANLQPAGQELVTVEFRELQHFGVPRGWTAVRHLGGCVKHVSCPKPGRPAWLRVVKTKPAPVPYAIDYPIPYISELDLNVEDGLNAITIRVRNANAALPVKNEVAAAERLARRLVPRFRWR